MNITFSNFYKWISLFALSFIISFFLTPLMIFLSKKLKILDLPEERKIHKTPIPLLGGVSIYISFASVILYNFNFSLQLKGICLGATLIFLVGLIDDIIEIPALIKLIFQVLACIILIHYGVFLTLPKFYHILWIRILSYLLTILWVIYITNSINFLDGIDGLVTGFSSVSCLFFLIISLQTGQLYLAYLTVILLGALLGFIKYNFYPAKIFLGDNGSTFIGFSLASFAVMGWWAENNTVVAFGTPILILSIPLFDLIYISFSRIISKKVRNFKEWIEYVGKDHIHHRLLEKNFSQKEICFLLYSLSISLSIGAIILREIKKEEVFLIILQVFFILLLISILIKGGKKTFD